MDNQIKIEKICLNDVLDHRSTFNDLPHFMYGVEEYDAQIYDTELEKWYGPLAHLMRTPYEWYYDFTPEEIADLADACRSGRMTNKRPPRLEEELTDIETRMQIAWQPGHWFVRFNAASPKDSYIPSYGLTCPREVINALVTSERLMKNCFNDQRIGRNCRLYFAKFDPNWKIDHEWRVFVYQKQVRAISQYNWFAIAHWFDQVTDKHLEATGRLICQFVEQQVQPLLSDEEQTYVIDIYLDPRSTLDSETGQINHDIQPEIVELNNYICAGACLMRWRIDSDIIPKKELSSHKPLKAHPTIIRIVDLP